MYTFKTKAATLCEQPMNIRFGGERVRWSFFFYNKKVKKALKTQVRDQALPTDMDESEH